MSERKITFQNSNGQRLVGLLSVPQGSGPFPTIIRAHGYGGSKNGRTSSILAEQFQDYVFLRFDFHGHGESEGAFEDVDVLQCVDDMRCALEYVRSLAEVDRDWIAITGSSLGGLAATLTAAWDKGVAALVLVCPVSDFGPLRVSALRYAHIMKYDVYKESEKITAPTLIIHGDNDDVVPLAQSVRLAQHIKNSSLCVVKNADHNFTRAEHFEEMITRTTTFIKQHLAN